MRPIRLAANQPRRFYRGGEAIARFRGAAPAADHVPEDWVGSTTPFHEDAPRGLSVLPDGRLLRDAVAAEPELFLGPAHVRRFGADPAVLVKLLDAGERLPVHWHPDDAFAAEHLGARYGKSEAWLVLSAEGGARARVGFRDDVDEQTLRDWFEQQDVDAMLAALNDVEAAPGDCIYVPAGIPHAIDEGIFMIEVQEPSDLGVMLEWRGFGFDPDAATIGLGPEVALRSARREAVSRGELADWTRRSGEAPQLRDGAAAVVPPDAERFFRAEWLRPDPGTTLEPAWSVLVAVAGAGRLSTEGGELDVAAGDTVLVPYAAGTGELLGEVEAVRCLPPRSEEAS